MHNHHLFFASCLTFTLFACELDDHIHVVTSSVPRDGGGTTAGTTGTSAATGGKGGAATTAATTGAATTGSAGAATTAAATTTTGDMTTGAGGSGGAGGGGSGGGTGGPTGITLTNTTNSEVTPGMGGSEFSQACLDGQVLVSFNGTWGGTYMGLESLQATCATLAITPAAPYQVTLTPDGTTLGPYGQVSPQTIDGPCPDGQVVVGFEGRSGDWVDQLLFHCAPLTISDVGGSYTLEVGSANPSATAVGPSTGTPFSVLSCETGKIAVGIFGRSGAAIDAIGLQCATPTLTTMRR